MNKLVDNINFDDGPNKVNSILVNNYGYDLFDFAYSLAIAVCKEQPIKSWRFWPLLKKEAPDIFEQYRDDIKLLKEINEGLIRKLDKHLKNVQYWGLVKGSIKEPFCSPFFPVQKIPGELNNLNVKKRRRKKHKFTINKRREIIKELYKLNETINAEIDYYERYLSYYRNKKGRPVFPKTIIASLWSLIMRDKNGIHYDRIAELLIWFSEKLKNADYGKEFSKSIKKNPPGEREITRFHNKFPNVLEEDSRDIFFHNYREFKKKQKVYSFRISFEKEKPKFFPIEPTEEQSIDLITFSGSSKFPE